MAKLKVNSHNELYCDKCRMLVRRLSPYCGFCGAFFSNYEEYLVENTKTNENSEIYKDM